MELPLPMYNMRTYFSLKNLGKTVCIIPTKIWYVIGDLRMCGQR